MVNECIQACRRVDVDLLRRPVEVMLQAAPRLVLGIQVQKRKRNAVRLKPLGQCQHATSFPCSSFPAHGEDDSFCLPVRLRAFRFLPYFYAAHCCLPLLPDPWNNP
jgi:hypothetical protein